MPRNTTTSVYEVDDHPNFQAIFNAELNRIAQQEFPYSAARDAISDEKIRITSLLPNGFKVVRQYSSGSYRTMLLARRKDAVLLLEVCGGRESSHLYVYVAAGESALADFIATNIVAKIPPPKPIVETDVEIYVWMMGPTGPTYKVKTISVPLWEEVDQNYPKDVRRRLGNVMGDVKPVDQGKILLWHGQPGTGKTSAIRTLMREWKGWCSFHYVSDPEKMFSYPGYLLEVGAGNTGNFRLVICEDTGQFLKSDASETSGAAMGRLLNFSDGILGQGSNTLFLLTTNEDLGNLHPAITRPGRCYHNMQFPVFEQWEAEEWLATKEVDHYPTGSMTLAELIACQKTQNSLQLESAEV